MIGSSKQEIHSDIQSNAPNKIRCKMMQFVYSTNSTNWHCFNLCSAIHRQNSFENVFAFLLVPKAKIFAKLPHGQTDNCLAESVLDWLISKLLYQILP